VSVTVACTALALLVLASMFAALRAWIKPEPHAETAAASATTGEAPREGVVIYRRPDGTSCQHKSFDNESGKLSKAKPGPCDYSNQKSKHESGSGFSWGGR